MPKAKNAKADEALALYRQGLKLCDIAAKLDVPEGTIRSWKKRRCWDCNVAAEKPQQNCNVAKRKRGAQPGNKNASGGPPGNKKAEKFGFLSKYLPEETLEIFRETATADPLELLWQNIQISQAAIIRAQRIAYVHDQQDKTVEIVMESSGEGGSSTAWDIQQAWEKQAAFLKAQAAAQATLRGMIKQYDEMLRARGERATEEQRLRLELLRRQLGEGADGPRKVTIINDTGNGPNQ